MVPCKLPRNIIKLRELPLRSDWILSQRLADVQGNAAQQSFARARRDTTGHEEQRNTIGKD
jgi:hypothetical protein